MNGAAVMAGVPPAIAPPSSLLSSYNLSLSLNLSSILSMLPGSGSRFLARLRKGSFGTLLWDPSDVSPTSVVEEVWASTFADATTTIAASDVLRTTMPSDLDHQPTFPGPGAFFTSWYMVGLFIMAVLLHRMQNIVLPSRLPARRSRHAYRFAPSYSHPLHHRILDWRRLYTSVLPLDFSRTTTRLIFHLPSAYFLGKMLLTWFCLVLQTSDMYPSFTENQVARWAVLRWVGELGNWVAQKEMSDICWQTFVAVCGAFLVEGFVRALVGLGTGFPIGSHDPNTSPFNLVGYAFLLHVYSSPVAHAHKPNSELPSRPDKHAIITIAIPLLQLFIFHILSISKRLSTHRLFPTLLSSLLSLAHFHGTLFSYFFSRSSMKSLLSSSLTVDPAQTVITASLASPSSGSRPTTATTTFSATSASPASSSTSVPMIRTMSHRLAYVPLPMPMPSIKYPLLNYIPNILETILMLIILLTISFNALVQLLVLGRVERLFSGMGIGQGLRDEDDRERGFLQNLPQDEDWGVVLLRVGIACLEATGLRGWSNEVAPINMPMPFPRRQIKRSRRRGLDAPGMLEPETTYGVVSLGRGGVADMQYGYAAPSESGLRTQGRRGDAYGNNDSRPLERIRGLLNEVRSVDLGNNPDEHGDFFYNTQSNNAHPHHRRQRRNGGFWRRWAREMLTFLLTLWSVILGLIVFLFEKSKEGIRSLGKKKKTVPEPVNGDGGTRGGKSAAEVARGDWRLDEDKVEEVRKRKEKELYERFLRGEEISDDEEEEGMVSSEEEDEESSIEEEEGEPTEDRGAEALGLFTDLLRNPGSGSTRSAGAPGVSGSGEMVLAHLVHSTTLNGGGSPLTRRRWNALFNSRSRRRGSPSAGAGAWGGDEYEDDDTFWGGEAYSTALKRPELDRRVEGPVQVQSTCVICTIEARDIICWPCRCLAMCDSCREALASKSAPSKHRCPCCRQSVDGYSKIYIP